MHTTVLSASWMVAMFIYMCDFIFYAYMISVQLNIWCIV